MLLQFWKRTCGGSSPISTKFGLTRGWELAPYSWVQFSYSLHLEFGYPVLTRIILLLGRNYVHFSKIPFDRNTNEELIPFFRSNVAKGVEGITQGLQNIPAESSSTTLLFICKGWWHENALHLGGWLGIKWKLEKFGKKHSLRKMNLN